MQEKSFFIYHTLQIQKLPGSAPDPTGGAHDAPPNPLVVWGGRPSSHPSPSAPSAPRFLRGAEGAYLIYLSGPPLSKILDPPLYIYIYFIRAHEQNKHTHIRTHMPLSFIKK